MQLLKTRGIVFKTMKYSETSIIADIYTRQAGLRSFIISGVRSPRAKTKAGLFQLMSILELVAYDKGDGKLSRIKEVRLAQHYHSLLFDVIKASVGTFMLEMTRNSIRESEANPPLYDFTESSFLQLDQLQENIANFHLRYLYDLSRYIGFLPDLEYKQGDYFDLAEGRFAATPHSTHFASAEDSALLYSLFSLPADQSLSLPLASSQRKALLDHLITYYKLHLDQFAEVRSIDVLAAILH